MDIGERTTARVIPVACILSEERERREEVTRDLFERSTGTRELDDGYEYAFPGDAAVAGEIMCFVVGERECCRFLAFEISFEPDEGPIRLRVRGPEGTKAFLTGAPGGGA